MFLNYVNWDVSPEIFTIPGIDWPLRWYGLCWLAAILSSFFIMNLVYKTEGRTNQQLDRLTMYIVLGTVIGARLGHCLFYGPLWDMYDVQGNLLEEGYLDHPLNLLKVYEGGLASHGGAIGIIIGAIYYCRKEKESLLWVFDRLMIAVPLASMFIRLGNLMNSEIIGKPTNSSFGFIFSRIDNVPRYPAQLYEAIAYLFLFVLMFWLWKNKRNVLGSGFMFGILLTIMFTVRFFIEFIKENQVEFENDLTLNMGQILSIPFVLIGIYLMVRSKKHLPLVGSK
jgi:phosphatidylglycerol:prolipoprotein diacylglycerol transferase